MGRSRYSRGFAALALVVAMVLLAAACGSSSKKSGSNNNNGSSSGNASTGGITNGADAGTPVRGGNLTYGIEADTAGGFCLFKAQLAIGGIQVARAIYDTLTMPGADGKIYPYLAQSVTGSNNNTLWTIKLRPGIKFHDGTDLTAEVVKENLDNYRQKNPLFVFVFPDVKSVDVVDNLTLTVSMKRPWTAFPWFLWGSSRLGIMAKAQMDSPDCNTKLIGTGPFVCNGACWKFGDKTTLQRNPNYWQKDKSGQPLPYLDSITFVPQEDGPSRLRSLESGDFQVIHTSDGKQITPINADVKSGTLHAVESSKFAEVSYTLLNTCASTSQPGCSSGNVSPFSHLSARQAFAYAIDRETYNKLRNDNLFQNASGPFAPGSDGYVADTGLPTFDPAKAKAAAAQYQQETGKPLTFTLNHTADTDTTADAVLLQQMLKQNAGINITLNSVPDQSTLINLAVSRKFDATVWRNHPGADPDTQYVWWHCANGTAAADAPDPMTPNCDNIVNFGGFNDPVINKAFDDARTNPDLAARTADYQTINRQFAKQLYDLWGQWVLWTVAMKPNVHGVLNIPLPDGAAVYDGLATGHPVLGMWCDAGKC